MTFPKWPKWLRNAAGDARVFDTPESVEAGWMTVEEYAALSPLDHDGDGKPGGSLPKRRRRAK